MNSLQIVNTILHRAPGKSWLMFYWNSGRSKAVDKLQFVEITMWLILQGIESPEYQLLGHEKKKI